MLEVHACVRVVMWSESGSTTGSIILTILHVHPKARREDVSALLVAQVLVTF